MTKEITITLPVNEAQALADMVDYGIDEKRYVLDKTDHCYESAEVATQEETVKRARDALLKLLNAIQD